MALRYPILFPHGEQSWNAKVPLRGFERSSRLLARRTIPSGRLLRHTVAFGDENQIDPGQPVDDPNPLQVEGPPDPEDEGESVAVGRVGSKRTTQEQFYAHMLQVSLPYHLLYYTTFLFGHSSFPFCKPSHRQ